MLRPKHADAVLFALCACAAWRVTSSWLAFAGACILFYSLLLFMRLLLLFMSMFILFSSLKEDE